MTETVFANAYSGATKGAEPPQIHGKLLALRRAIKSLKAEKVNGVMFPVRGAKDLNQKMADALNDLDLLAPVVAQEVVLIPVADIPPRPDGKPVFRTLAHIKATVRIIAPDGSFLDMVGSGHGGDADDKAGGKASTYAWKDAVLKGLTIPHADMVDTDDESGQGSGSDPRPAGKTPTATVTSGPELPVGPRPGLTEALAALAAATSVADLEAVRADVAAQKYNIAKGDSLTLSKEYVARKKAMGV